jgi:hypothetical protein
LALVILWICKFSVKCCTLLLQFRKSSFIVIFRLNRSETHKRYPLPFLFLACTMLSEVLTFQSIVLHWMQNTQTGSLICIHFILRNTLYDGYHAIRAVSRKEHIAVHSFCVHLVYHSHLKMSTLFRGKFSHHANFCMFRRNLSKNLYGMPIETDG